MRRANVLFLLASCLLISGAAMGQGLATIVGAVTDPSHAAIPDAKITVSNNAVGFNRVYATSPAGTYTAAKIPLGKYVVTAEAPGFRKEVRTEITLNAGQTQRVDFQLVVGTTQQSVTVAGNVPQVQTESGTISSVITGKQVTQLNLIANTFVNLASLIPGAAPDGGGFGPDSVSNVSSVTLPVNGVPGNYNNWELDGVNIVQQGSNSDDVNIYPSLDVIAEFRISTSDYSAEFPKSAGANVEVVTKSGTNQFHGSAFDFVRNDALDANDWFINRTPGLTNAPKTPLKRNDFGFTLGGPVYIPGHYNTNKQKTFFFLSEEWRRNRDGTVFNTYTPSLLMRQGNFSQCDPTSGAYNPVVASGCKVPINPTTGLPTDQVTVNPTAAAMLKGLVPLPNSGPVGYTSAPESTLNSREDSVRIDQNISDKVRVFARWTQDFYNENFLPSWAGGNYPTVKTSWIEADKSGVLNLTQSLRPNLLNEVIVGFGSDQINLISDNGVSSPAGSIDKPSGFSFTNIFPQNRTLPLLPGFSVSGGIPSFSQSTGFEFDLYSPMLELKDNLVWSRGKHILHAGFFLTQNRINNTTGVGSGDPYGMFDFSSSSPVSTGNALADMYLGQIASYTEYGAVKNGQLYGGYQLGHWRQWDFEPYVEDDWRVTPRLTLNLGARYFYWTPWADASLPNLDSVFVPSLYNPADQSQLSASGYLEPGTGQSYLNYGNGLVECGTGNVVTGCTALYKGTISPRFGFAWEPTGSDRTVIRGGYALVWDSGNSHNSATGRYGKPPLVATISSFNVSGYQNIVPGPIPTTNFHNQPLSAKLPEIDQYNLTVEHEFPGNNILSVAYVGSLGRDLQRLRDMNQVPDGATTDLVPALAGTPGCDAVGDCNVQQSLINELHSSIYFRPYRGYTTMDNREYTGSSSYNSLQVSFRHTTGFGLTFQSSYTWAHTLDNIWGAGGTGASPSGIDDSNANRWWGTSSINQTQVWVMNYIYNLPFFLHATNHFLRTGLGGWEVSGITTFSTGPPIETNCGISGFSSGVGGAVRCNTLGPVNVQKGVYNDPTYGPTPTWYNPAVVGQVDMSQLASNGEPGMFGYMAKNALTGPGRNDWDLGLFKSFSLPWFHSETSTLQLRLETFNTFNHPQWSGVNYGCSGLTAPGQPCNGPNNIGAGEVTSAHPPRQMQLALKLLF
jgi:hypothetical protein